jgi:hypothetical protein
MNFVDVQEIFKVTATESLLEHVGCDTGLQAAADACSGFGMQNDPRFGFAVFDRVKGFGLLIVGVYLEREPVVGIEELDEQWKLFEVCVLTEQFLGVLLQEFWEGEAGEWTGGNLAGAIRVVRDFPAFGVVRFGSEAASEQGLKFSTAPANAFEDGSGGRVRLAGIARIQQAKLSDAKIGIRRGRGGCAERLESLSCTVDSG